MTTVNNGALPADTEQELKVQHEGDRWLEMFALFVHDIESPLASVKYLLKLLEDGKYDPNRQIHQRLVSSSKVALTRAETIIYDIMAVAKAGGRGLPVSVSELDPYPLIQESILLIHGAAAERNIQVNLAKVTHRWQVHADPSLLKRTLDNLLYNAFRHTPDGGAIDVYIFEETESLFINVKDSGPGLGNVDSEKLFEKYGQLELRSDGKHRGVGLGLYFCKLAATGMGGTVIADDHPEGGAVFTLRLKKAGGKSK